MVVRIQYAVRVRFRVRRLEQSILAFKWNISVFNQFILPDKQNPMNQELIKFMESIIQTYQEILNNCPSIFDTFKRKIQALEFLTLRKGSKVLKIYQGYKDLVLIKPKEKCVFDTLYKMLLSLGLPLTRDGNLCCLYLAMSYSCKSKIINSLKANPQLAELSEIKSKEYLISKYYIKHDQYWKEKIRAHLERLRVFVAEQPEIICEARA